MDLLLVVLGLGCLIAFIGTWIENGRWTHSVTISLALLIGCIFGIYYINAGEINEIYVKIDKFDKVVSVDNIKFEIDSPAFFAIVETGRPFSAFSGKATKILDVDYSNLKTRINKILQKYPSAKVETENNTQMEKEN